MESNTYNYTLTDLLCLMQIDRPIDHIKAVTEWAEREVMSGNGSETLLILAALSLDKTLDEYEVMLYLDRYLIEVGISYPSRELSALIWLRIQLWQLTHSEDANTAESLLYLFVKTYFWFGPRFFSKTCDYLNWLYYSIFDDCSDLYPSEASKMTEADILSYIRKYVAPFERILFNDDWLNFLSKK
ncbi:hypothetical protein [Serratia sp. D1N4]